MFTMADEERVVLLDRRGRAAGTADKATVHDQDTPLHLAFSCYVVDGAGRVLLTRRSVHKRTWPGAWTNACCGHPSAGETLRAAVTRRLQAELGLVPTRMALALSDFTYRAVMDNGVVEHELCPVVVAEVAGEPSLNPAEASEAAWVSWGALCERADRHPGSLSPWSVAQIARLTAAGISPPDWVADPSRTVGLDLSFDAPLTGPDRAGAPDPLAPIRRPVDALLERFMAARTTELVELDPSLASVAQAVADLVMAGGKRLRPAFVHWGHRAGGAGNHPGIASVAAAAEMLHTFALLHDDVMDRSDLRRGRPSAHRSFAAAHGREGLGGDADWFGTSAAILAGDVAFVWADQLLDGAPLEPCALARVRAVFTQLRAEVMAGQYLDLRLSSLEAPDPAAAERVALLKSGRYTVTRPLALGLAAVTGERPAVGQALARYGDALGVAFQLRDDVLGLFGDERQTGKSSSDDLREGKRTVLVLRALALATPTERAALRRCLGDRRLDEGQVERCREIVAGTGALASVETRVRELHAVAVDALAPVAEPARTALLTLADDAVVREH